MKTRYGFTQLTVAALTLGFAGVAMAQAPTSATVFVGGSAIGHTPTSGVAGPGNGAAASISTTGMALPRAGETNIASSRHNLGSTGVAGNHTPALFDDSGTVVLGTNQICVFCHTPHGKNQAETAAPLWNKTLGTTYTKYVSNTNTDGEILAVGNVSLACLSCHDGTQAMDNMLNGPGSHNMSENGANTGASQGYVWLEFANMGQGVNPAGTANVQLTSVNPTIEGINIGTDLSNDHPIGMQYCGGGTTVAAQSGSAAGDALGACGDRQYILPKTAVINTKRVFWVDTETMQDPDALIYAASGAETSAITRTSNSTAILNLTSNAYKVTAANDSNLRTKSDLPLFVRTFAAGDSPSVECASCHDVHTANNGTFLRVSNYGSGLCLSCHVK